VLPGLAVARIATVSVAPSVTSTGTTAVAPDGSGAPVMIRCAVPGFSVSDSVRPAGMSSATGSSTGSVLAGAAMSSATTAYPSIAELSKPGSDSGATTSSASTSPSVSASGTRPAAGTRSARRRRSGVLRRIACSHGNFTSVSSSEALHSRALEFLVV
jgi:hypothetical protein